MPTQEVKLSPNCEYACCGVRQAYPEQGTLVARNFWKGILVLRNVYHNLSKETGRQMNLKTLVDRQARLVDLSSFLVVRAAVVSGGVP